MRLMPSKVMAIPVARWRRRRGRCKLHSISFRLPIPRRCFHGAREELALGPRRWFGGPLRVAHVAAPPGAGEPAAPPLREAFLVHELVRAVAVAGGDELVFVRIFEAEAALGHRGALLSRCGSPGILVASRRSPRRQPAPRRSLNCPDFAFVFGRRTDAWGQPANALRCRPGQRQRARR